MQAWRAREICAHISFRYLNMLGHREDMRLSFAYSSIIGGRYMRMTRFATTEEAERNAPMKKPREHFLPVTQHVLLPEENVKCRRMDVRSRVRSPGLFLWSTNAQRLLGPFYDKEVSCGYCGLFMNPMFMNPHSSDGRTAAPPEDHHAARLYP